MKRILLLFLLCGPALGVGTFSYTESTNTIQVTDGTSGAPATFNDMYTADQAGTGTLLLDDGNPNEGGAGANNPLTLTYAVRPTHDKAIQVKCVVAAKTAEADFVFITGTDWRGAAQTESIDVTAGNGSYTSTKYWATITSLDCSDNAAGGGTAWADGTLDVTQDIWGVVWEFTADRAYQIDAHIEIGDGSTATFFRSENECVVFASDITLQTVNAATCELGQLSNSYPINGSHWQFNVSSNMYLVPVSGAATAAFNIYGSILTSSGKDFYWSDGDIAFLRTNLFFTTATECPGFTSGIESLSLTDIFISGANRLTLSLTPDVAERLHVHNASYAYMAGKDATISNATWSGVGIAQVDQVGAYTLTMQDPVANITSPVGGDASSIMIEQYTCNIHTADEDGADLTGVSIACTTFGNVVSNDAGSTFYKCVEDHTSGTFATDVAAGKWEATTAAYAALAGCTGAAANGAWVTGIDYVASTTEFTGITTDSDGDIAEQTIDYKKWIGTSEALLTYSPHTFTLTYGGDTHVVTDFVVTSPIIWHLEFPPVATMLTAIYNKLPSADYLMGSSVATAKDDEIDAILVDTGTTIPGTITTAQNDLDIITGASGVLIDTDAVDSDAIKADAVTEIQSGLATGANVTNAHATTDAAIAVVDGIVDAILIDTGTTLDNHLTDIKGTGFVKDTHSLTNIEGYVDLIDDGTSGLAKIATDAAAVLVDTAEIGVAGAGLTAIPWNSAWDAEVESESNDALVALNLDHLLKTAVANNADMTTEVTDGSILSNLMTSDSDTSGYVVSMDSFEAIADAIVDLNDLSASDVNTAVWTALVADFTGEMTFGGDVGGLDPNLTLVLADTDELQTDWTDGGRLDLLIDAIKAITDLLPVVTTTVSVSDDANSFTCTAGKASTDAYYGHVIMVEDADDSNRELRCIEYWSSARVVEVDFPFSFTPEVGDNVWIWTGYLGDLLEAMDRSNSGIYLFDNRPGTTRGQGMTVFTASGEDP